MSHLIQSRYPISVAGVNVFVGVNMSKFKIHKKYEKIY